MREPWRLPTFPLTTRKRLTQGPGSFPGMCRLARILTLMALLQICGGHWGVLQTVAWTKMVAGYLQEQSSLPEALEKTLNGRNPCSMCKAVSEGRSEEKRQDSAKTVLKFEAILQTAACLPLPAEEAFHYSAREDQAPRLNYPPVAPPPLRA